MDRWKDTELEKMKIGGNRKCKEFFQAQSDFKQNWPFHDKWNSKAAALYRDKISTLAKGEQWSADTSPAKNWSDSGSSAIKSSQSYAPTRGTMESDFGYSKNDISYQRDDYFGEHDRFSSSGPGGRYSGFGNTNFDNDKTSARSTNDYLEGAMSHLSFGWSVLSKGAVQAASLAKEGAVNLSSQATSKASVLADHVKDGSIIHGVQATVTGAASKAAEYGQKSWHGIQSALGEKGFSPLSFYSDSPNPNGGGVSEKSGLMKNVGGSKKAGGYSKLGGTDNEGGLLEFNETSRGEEWGHWSQDEKRQSDDFSGYNRSDVPTPRQPPADAPKSHEIPRPSSGSGSTTPSALPKPPSKQSVKEKMSPNSGARASHVTPGAGHVTPGSQQQPQKSNGGSNNNLIDFGAGGGGAKAAKKSDWDDDAWNILNS